MQRKHTVDVSCYSEPGSMGGLKVKYSPHRSFSSSKGMSHSPCNNVGGPYIILSAKDFKDYLQYNRLCIRLKITTVRYTS